MDILEHLGMLVPDIEGHGVITGRASITEQELYTLFTLLIVMVHVLMFACLLRSHC